MDDDAVRARLDDLRADLLKRSLRNPSSSRSSSGRTSASVDLSDVDRALGMLEKGTYGMCETCGLPISAERLDAYPASRFCLKDQRSQER